MSYAYLRRGFPNSVPANVGGFPIVTPMPSDRIVDSFAVVAHIDNSAAYPAYAQQDGSGNYLVAATMASLGVRWYRFMAKQSSGTDSTITGVMSQMVGVASALCVVGKGDTHSGGTLGAAGSVGTAAQVLNAINQLAAAGYSVAALESWNEPNLTVSGGGYNGTDGTIQTGWVADARAWIQDIWTNARSGTYSHLTSLPILSSAIGGDDPTSHTALGSTSAYCDTGNLHTYPRRHNPDYAIKGSFTTSDSVDLYDAAIAAGNFSNSAPFWTTELGYSDNGSGGSNGMSGGDATIAQYGPKVIFEGLYNGCQRRFWYEFNDGYDPSTRTDPNSDENGFGLYTYNATVANSWQPKPVATALKNLFSLVTDKNGSPTLTPLQISISGPADVRTLLSRHSNGAYFLAIWRAVDLWSGGYTGSPVTIASENVAISLQNPATFAVYQPDAGTAALSGFPASGTSITVPVDGSAYLLKMS